MKKKINLTELVDLIADCITNGIDINVDSDSKVKTIAVHNSLNGQAVKFTFEVPVLGACVIGDWEETPQQVKKPQD